MQKQRINNRFNPETVRKLKARADKDFNGSVQECLDSLLGVRVKRVWRKLESVFDFIQSYNQTAEVKVYPSYSVFQQLSGSFHHSTKEWMNLNQKRLSEYADSLGISQSNNYKVRVSTLKDIYRESVSELEMAA